MDQGSNNKQKKYEDCFCCGDCCRDTESFHCRVLEIIRL